MIKNTQKFYEVVQMTHALYFNSSNDAFIIGGGEKMTFRCIVILSSMIMKLQICTGCALCLIECALSPADISLSSLLNAP